MRLSTRTLFLAALATVLATACSDKTEEPIPADPDSTLRMGSYFDFTTITPAGGTAHSGFGTTHSSLDIKGSAAMDTHLLVLDFSAGTDAVHFEIDRTKLTASLLGAYALRSSARPTEPVFTSYVYRRNGGSSIYRFSDFTQNLTGDVTITAYDAKRQLASGHYEVRAPEQRDPTSIGINNDPTCTILLAGDFENLKVKTQ
ncbi:hypothetical protein MTX78_00410 [Hymenobacter tibetensis]|uniref:Lipoprotein n=1 Tax=Hymenobacter tibetensis TaxID=497967 RepID=A0ABY4D1G2_9BACT|nr:hypothetical protein [Hymenobacter tibetensis]UOG75074.1 hypothetical protein MTX78_00410 [Hymenobacter tibetensis]